MKHADFCREFNRNGIVIGNLINLYSLDLAHNKLTTLPENICKLKKLEELGLSYNNIEVLPQSIGNLANLVSLYLNHNKLSKIPRSTGKLKTLRRLEIVDNKLKSLPQSLSTMSSLEFIIFKNNKIADPPVFRNLIMMPSLSAGYKNLKGLQIAMETTQELSIIDIFKNLKGNANRLLQFYTDYFRFSKLFDAKKLNLPKNVIELIENRKYMDLISYYQKPEPTSIGKNKFQRKKKIS